MVAAISSLLLLLSAWNSLGSYSSYMVFPIYSRWSISGTFKARRSSDEFEGQGSLIHGIESGQLSSVEVIYAILAFTNFSRWEFLERIEQITRLFRCLQTRFPLILSLVQVDLRVRLYAMILEPLGKAFKFVDPGNFRVIWRILPPPHHSLSFLSDSLVLSPIH